MSNILVQPQQLRQTAEQLRSHAQKIDQALHAIDNDIRSLKGHHFLGHRADQVQAHYAPKRDALLQAKQLVLRFAEELDQAASVFEQADRGGGPPSIGVPTPPIRPKPPVFPPGRKSTEMLGEEGQQTHSLGEEGIAVTMAIPESGEMPILWPPRDILPVDPPKWTTMALSEEGQEHPWLPPKLKPPTYTTLALGEEGQSPFPGIEPIRPFPIPPALTLALGEDGHYPFPWMPIIIDDVFDPGWDLIKDCRWYPEEKLFRVAKILQVD